MKTRKSLLALAGLLTFTLAGCNNPATSSTPSSSVSTPDSSVSTPSDTGVSTPVSSGTGDSSTPSSSTSVQEEFVIRISKATGITMTADKTKAKAGETVTVTVGVEKGFTLVEIRANEVALTKVNDTTYTFVMPATSVLVTARLSVSGDVTIQGDFTAALTKGEDGIYTAKGVKVLGDGNFSLVIKNKEGGQTELSPADIDRTKCFGNFDVGTSTGRLEDGGTYDFFYDPSSAKPLYFQRTAVNVLPNSASTLYNLFYGRVQSSPANFAPGLTKLTYSNTEEGTKADYTLSADGLTSLTKYTDNFNKDTGIVYRSLDANNSIFKFIDTTASFEGRAGKAGKYKVSNVNTQTGSEIDNVDWNDDSQFISPLLSKFEVQDSGFDMYNIEFKFMDSYRVGMVVEDYVKSAKVEITSEKTDSGFTTKLVSSKTYDSSGATDSSIVKKKEHTEYRVSFEFLANGALKSVDYTSKIYDTNTYDFSSDSFINGTPDENFANTGTILKKIAINCEYNQKNDVEFDATPYFITSLSNVTINNPQAGQGNTINSGDKLSSDSDLLKFDYAPATALDSWQYVVTESDNKSVVRWNDDYNRFEAASEGEAKVTISNLSDKTVTATVDLTVVYNILVRNFYIQRFSYSETDYDVDTSTSATIYAGGQYRFMLSASGDEPTGDVALPPDTKVTYTNDSHGLLSYVDAVNSKLTFDTSKMEITSPVTVNLTISTEHKRNNFGSTDFSITVKPSQGATISALKGTWKNTEKSATAVIAEDNIEVDGQTSANHGTLVVAGQTFNFAFLVDAGSGKFSYSRIIDADNKTLSTYSLRMTYSQAEGLGFCLSTSTWEGQDSGSTTYILGDESGDDDFNEYTYDYFTKA